MKEKMKHEYEWEKKYNEEIQKKQEFELWVRENTRKEILLSKERKEAAKIIQK